MADTILEVRNLTKHFKTKHGMLHAVDGVDFKLARGKTLGLVGESGCGKSTTGRTILRLIEPTAGEIIFEGKDINKLSRSELRHARKDMQLIFQDPYYSLDPRKTVSQIISEPIIANKILKSSADIDARVAELMSTVGLAARLFNAYPHELYGGRRQRLRRACFGAGCFHSGADPQPAEGAAERVQSFLYLHYARSFRGQPFFG